MRFIFPVVVRTQLDCFRFRLNFINPSRVSLLEEPSHILNHKVTCRHRNTWVINKIKYNKEFSELEEYIVKKRDE